ncbi:MAG: AraC family transcriptional regulator [Ruminococcaceae bacterium]|nr:AraC family transcriptional regulator [Oscillospiraceae bacterium]
MLLIQSTVFSVTETARQCVLSSVHYFSRKFKEKIEGSPSHYLKISGISTTKNTIPD